MQKMSVLTIHTYKKMRVSLAYIYKKMRVSLAYIYKKRRMTIVFKQLFIFIFWVFRKNKTLSI